MKKTHQVLEILVREIEKASKILANKMYVRATQTLFMVGRHVILERGNVSTGNTLYSRVARPRTLFPRG